MPGSLEFIKSGTGSSVSNLSITDCFSNDYDVYKVVIYQIGTSGTDLKWRLINSSGVVTSANYDSAVSLMRSYGSFGDNRTQNGTEFNSVGFSDYTDRGGATVLDIYNPFNSSFFTLANWQNAGTSTIGTPVRKGIGVYTVAESHTGINFTASSTIDNVGANVYGVK